jgi:hypothetical protein
MELKATGERQVIQMSESQGKQEYDSIMGQIKADLEGRQTNRYHNILKNLQDNILLVIFIFCSFY